MHETPTVYVINRLKELPNDIFGDFVLGETESFDESEQICEQKLGDHVDRVIGSVDTMQFGNIGMLQTFPNIDLVDEVTLNNSNNTLSSLLKLSWFTLFFEHFTAKFL